MLLVSIFKHIISEYHILLYRKVIFGSCFPYLLKEICTCGKLKNIYVKIIVKYWELPEIQSNVDIIINTFHNIKSFYKELLYKAIKFDDANLYKKISNLRYLNKEKNVHNVKKFCALELAEYSSVSFHEAFINDIYSIIPMFLPNKEDLEHFIIHRLKEAHKSLNQVILTKLYYNTIEFIHGNENDIVIQSGNPQMYRNIIKYIFKKTNVFYDLDLHKRMLNKHILLFCYEYLTEPIFKELVPIMIEKMIERMYDGVSVFETVWHCPSALYLAYISNNYNRQIVVDYHFSKCRRLSYKYLDTLPLKIFRTEDYTGFGDKIFSTRNKGMAAHLLRKRSKKIRRSDAPTLDNLL